MDKLHRIGNVFVIETPRELVMRIFSSWILIALFHVMNIKGFINLEFCEQVDFIKYLLYMVIAFVALSGFIKICAPVNDDILLLGITLLYAIKVLKESTDVYFLFGISFFVVMIFLYCYPNIKGYTYPIKLSDRSVLCIIGIVFISVTGFVSLTTILRYMESRSSNFDMGIFVQTFYNLKENFTLDNTCERNQPLSHLQVHVSLFYYLLAPVYWLFPKAQTLLVLQAAAVSTGVIPLLLLARHKGLSNKNLVGIGVIYLLSIAAWGGCYYDFHENVFLLPLLLWCFYCYETNRTKLMFLFAFLVCTVKEDAPLYILVFGMYLLLCKGKKDLKKAILLLMMAGCYMAGAFYYLNQHGLGIMSYRYDNIMSNDSLLSIIKVILTNPVYLFSQVFNADKITFIILIFLPIAGMVFLTKKYHHLILMIPLLFINLLPDYTYQHSIFYQYVFAPTAFIMYLCVINLAQMKWDMRKKIVCISVILSVLAFASQIYEKKRYIEYYDKYEAERADIAAAFELIPDDASIVADTFFCPQLASRDEIYMLKKADVESGITYDMDYAIFDLRAGFTVDNLDAAINLYKSQGYEEIYYVEGTVLLLER